MKKRIARSEEQTTDSATNKLMDAHNEIISNWFEHWTTKERLRIDLSFEGSNATTNQRQVA